MGKQIQKAIKAAKEAMKHADTRTTDFLLVALQHLALARLASNNEDVKLPYGRPK